VPLKMLLNVAGFQLNWVLAIVYRMIFFVIGLIGGRLTLQKQGVLGQG
jgi:hypothetical protein